MPLNGFRWSRDSGSSLNNMSQTDVLGRAGGAQTMLMARHQKIAKLLDEDFLGETMTKSGENYELTL